MDQGIWDSIFGNQEHQVRVRIIMTMYVVAGKHKVLTNSSCAHTVRYSITPDTAFSDGQRVYPGLSHEDPLSNLHISFVPQGDDKSSSRNTRRV